MAMLSATRRPSGAIPTSSMADIAFLLLVFFLVTTVFPKDDGLALVLPQGEAEVHQGNVLHVLVGASGGVELRFGASPNSQLVSAQQLGGIWRQAMAGNPQLIAAVKTAPDAHYQRMVDVLDQLQGAGATRISLQVMPGGGR